jgi:hypothetical protein
VSVSVLGSREVAAVGVGLLSLQQVAVIGVGLFEGWADPFEVAENLAALQHATTLAYRRQYEGRTGDQHTMTALDIMRAIGRLLGIYDEPVASSVEGKFEWEFYGKDTIHELAWRYLRTREGAVKEARLGAWSLVYNAMDNSGHSHMSDRDREIAMYVCQALLVVGR